MQVATLRAKYGALMPVFTERSRRVWAATEAQAIGYGGIALVEPTAPGDPDSPLRWTSRSVRTLAVALEGVSPITDAIASGWYRGEVLPVHLGRLLLA